MNRDMSLIRALLLRVELLDAPTKAMAIEIEGVSPEAVAYHSAIADEAGLIVTDGGRSATRGSPNDRIVFRLSWAGHDFLDAARSEGIWLKVQATVREKAQTVSWDVLLDLLRATARGLLGLG